MGISSIKRIIFIKISTANADKLSGKLSNDSGIGSYRAERKGKGKGKGRSTANEGDDVIPIDNIR